jgi:hypothetical protein
MRRVKRQGIGSLPENISAPLDNLLEIPRKVGLFLVPVSELEGWLASEEIAVSKNKKAAWANAAALKIQSKGASQGDVWDFVRGVGKYFRGM